MISPSNSPTLRAHTLIQQNVASIKGRLDTARSEAVTGEIVDIGRAVNGDTAKVNLLSESIDYARDRMSVLDFEGNRMATGQNVLENVRDYAGETISALLFSSDAQSSGARSVAEQTASAALDDTIGNLNTSFGGRPLFGGDSSGAPLGDASDVIDAVRAFVVAGPDMTTALANIETWFNDPAGGFETTFFQGGDGDAPTVEVNKGDRVATTVRADDRSLRDTMRGFAIAAVMADAPNEESRGVLESVSVDILTNANQDVIELQTRLGVQEERVAGALADHEAQATTLSIAYNGLTTRDRAEAATEMRMLESQLEAAYLTTTRMANLSLNNYLR